MSLSSKVALSAVILHLICISLAVPISHQDKLGTASDDWNLQIFAVFIGISSLLCLISLLAVCTCCKRSRPFKLHSISAQIERITSQSLHGDGGSRSSCDFPQAASEIPLPGIFSSHSNSQVYFEPLPDINALQRGDLPVPAIVSSVDNNYSEKWFAEPFKNFPRNQLQYVRKIGSGWFGHVLEGRAAGINTDHTSTVIPASPFSRGENHSMPVVVKSLREDATAQEQAYFLQELLPYRDLEHPNILKLLAYCTETQPFLILLHLCPRGTLKSILQREIFNEEKLLKMCRDVSNGLLCMHQHNYIHSDLAARNCLVDTDLTVKIGDYGYSVEMYPEEYYLAENVALPLRWCAPETLMCTDNTIEMLQLTKTANIWSFGILLWEVLSHGKFPYKDLDDDGVIQKVILDKSAFLKCPTSDQNQIYLAKMNLILDMCWKIKEDRPDIIILHSLIHHLCANWLSQMSEEENKNFDRRWNEINQLPRNQNHNLDFSKPAQLKFESNFANRSCVSHPTKNEGLIVSSENLDAKVAATFGSAFPSWLGLEPGQPMDSLTEEISDAIQKLDEALSEEKSPFSSRTTSQEKSETPSFVLGQDCPVSNPPTPFHHNLSYSESQRSRTLSTGEEELLTLRLEQGEFSELVRIKSQSVQDFMRLTVVDDGSDSDKTSQPGSIDYANQTLGSEMNSASESNLKEAIRDAGFMVELGRLQSEHKFSIISEVSREGNYSIEYMPPAEETSMRSYHTDFEIPSGDASEKDLALSKMTASPDCIVSSRNKSLSALPDILVHSNTNFESKHSSSSSIDVREIKSLNLSSSENSVSEEDKLKSELELDNEVKKSYSKQETDKNDNMQPLDEFTRHLESDKFKVSPMETQTIPESDSSFAPEPLIQGEEVVIGALDDYSLEPFKSAKSSSNFSMVKSTCSNSSSLSSLSEQDLNTSSHSIDTEISIDAKISSIKDANDVIKLHADIKESEDTNCSESNCGSFSHLLDIQVQLKDAQYNENTKGIDSDNNNMLIPKSESNKITITAHDDKEVYPIVDNYQRPRSPIFPKSSDEVNFLEKSWENEQYNLSGEFWEQQMAAWQEAAQETRQLLHKASHPGMKEKNPSPYDSIDSEDELDLAKSPRTPASDGTLSKSPSSSTDRLDLDEEETYVSYYDSGDEEVLRYSPCDINNLRLELELKLGNPCDMSQPSEEEPQENIIINYRSSIPHTLSPIKEESFLSDFEFVESEKCETVNSLNTDDNSSVEFVEVDEELPNNSYSMNIAKYYSSSLDLNKDTLLPLNDGEFTHLSIEEARNSLILEDLENCEPVSPKVFGLISDNEPLGDDVLIVDTQTNKVTLLNSDRPQSHLAFLNTVSKPEPFNNSSNNDLDDSDDVAPESLPYEEKNEVKPSSPEVKTFDKINISSITEADSSVESIAQSDLPHYHPYFTSAFNSLNHPLPSLEDASLYDSEDHISLPYDVNYPDHQRDSFLNEAAASDSKKEALFLDGEEDSKEIANPEKLQSKNDSNGISLSFLGKLYNESEAPNKDSEVNHSSKSSNYDPGSNLAHEEIEENISAETLNDGEASNETPLMTPSHLQDFIWRQESPTKPSQEPCYTPDWESEAESDAEAIEEDMESSSTSGEFIWQVGDTSDITSKCKPADDKLHDQDHSSSSSENEGADDSESGEEEFTPSTWKNWMTPQRSLLKSPEATSLSKKNVHWKRQKHHRVYEYPPEPQSWHIETTSRNMRQQWGSHSLDYLTLADFDLVEDFMIEDSSDAGDLVYSKASSNSLYGLPQMAFDFEETSADGMFADDCEFYIRSSGTPFAFDRSSFSASDFFPNASTDFDYLFPEQQELRSTDTEGNLQVAPPPSQNINLNWDVSEGADPGQPEQEAVKVRPAESTATLGELNHVKDKLRLDIPSLSLDKTEENNTTSVYFNINKKENSESNSCTHEKEASPKSLSCASNDYEKQVDDPVPSPT